MGGRLLLAAWAVVLLAVAGTITWLAVAEPPASSGPSLVLALPPPTASAAATTGAAPAPAAEAAQPLAATASNAAPTGEARGTPTPALQPTAPGSAGAAQPAATDQAATGAPSVAWAQVASAREGSSAREAKRAWQANARPFSAAADRPRIAMVITDLGIAEAITSKALELPPDITLAFLPYTDDVKKWVTQARTAGHEVLLNLPMEPAGPGDAGPKALMTMLDSEQNLERLDWVLGRASGYVGVMPSMGSRFLTSEEHVRPVLADLRDRGLLFVDNGTTPRSVAVALAGDLRLSRAMSDRFVDSNPSRAAVDKRLREVEQIARETGAAVAVGRPYPSTIERIAEWARGLDARGYSLAPISAVVDRQSLK